MSSELYFLGIYSKKNSEDADTNLWQVWERLDGNLVVLPAGRPDGALPTPTYSVIRLEDFYDAFMFASSGKTDDYAEPPNIYDLKKTQLSPGEDGKEYSAPKTAEVSAPDADTVIATLQNDFIEAVNSLASARFSSTKELRRIISQPGPFSRDHKFVFTEFGGILRRHKLFSLACMCHERALELDSDDVHIMLNLARALYDSGNTANAREYLLKAVDIDPDFAEAHEFLAFLNAEGDPAADVFGK